MAVVRRRKNHSVWCTEGYITRTECRLVEENEDANEVDRQAYAGELHLSCQLQHQGENRTRRTRLMKWAIMEEQDSGMKLIDVPKVQVVRCNF